MKTLLKILIIILISNSFVLAKQSVVVSDSSGVINEEFNNSTAFITTWHTASDIESITISTYGGETYNYDVDWGDGTIENFSDISNVNHCYTNTGDYSEYDICVTLTSDGCNNPPVCKTISIGCGINIHHYSEPIFYKPSYKAIIETYVPWGVGCCLGWEEVSAQITNYYLFDGWLFDIWVISWADELKIDILLDPIRNTNTNSIYECNQEYRFNGPAQVTDWFTFTSEELFDPYYDPLFAVRPGECTATFWLTNNNQQYGPWVLDYAN